MSQCSVIIKTTNKYVRVIQCKDKGLKFADMTCSHRGGPLTHGIECEESIICPWHKKKTKKCRIRYLDIPYVESGKTVFVGIQGFERLIMKMDD